MYFRVAAASACVTADNLYIFEYLFPQPTIEFIDAVFLRILQVTTKLSEAGPTQSACQLRVLVKKFKCNEILFSKIIIFSLKEWKFRMQHSEHDNEPFYDPHS